MLTHFPFFLGKRQHENTFPNRLDPVPLKEATLCPEGEALVEEFRTAVLEKQRDTILRIHRELFQRGIRVTLEDA